MNNNNELIDANAQIQQWIAALTSSIPDWLENYVPAYTSMLVVHDLGLSDKFLVLAWLKLVAEELELLKNDDTANNIVSLKTANKHHLVDVCYSPTLNDALIQISRPSQMLPNDLYAVSQHSSLSIADIVELHTQTSYRVFTVGFLPNFAYMGLTAPALSIPRLTTPRKKVPAGAVAIADNQTAIYPQSSPGGWHILGYTPNDLGMGAKLTFRAGDSVSFNAITEHEYCERLLARD